MIKDPLHQEETPYEILKLEPSISQNGADEAISRFMNDKGNQPGLEKAREAIKKLKNPLTRLSIDILYYSIGELDLGVSNDAEIQSIIDSFVTVPLITEDEYYSDLKKEDFSGDFSEIKERKMDVNDLAKYNDIDSLTLGNALLANDV
jgi:hypothetical protein